MLESKLIVDSCIHLPSQWFKQNVVAGAFFDQPDKPMTLKISKSTKLSEKTETAPAIKAPARAMVAGTNTKESKEHRNFQWLGWWGGAISQVVRHKDVLTGPMSGCWIVVYRRDGMEYVAHIGKNKDNKAQTDAVIAGWNNYAQHHAADIICGFNPRRHWLGREPHPNALTDNGIYQCFALVTRDPNPRLFSVLTQRQKVDSNLLRIVGIEEVPSENADTLQHTD